MATVGDVLEFRTICRGPNQSNQVNVRHYRVMSIAGSGLTDQQIGDQFGILFASYIKPVLNVQATYQGLFVRRVYPSVGVQTSSIQNAGAGTRAGAPNPNMVCGITTLRASSAPPRRRGRVYWPVCSQADVLTTGDPSGTYQTALANATLALYATDSTLTVGANNVVIRPVIFHRAQPQANYDITSYLTRTYFATQRRRSTVHGGDRSLLG